MRKLVVSLMGVLIVGLSLAGCSTVASPDQEVYTVLESKKIVALDDTVGIWISSGLLSFAGGSTVDYMYAVENPDGSISQYLTSNWRINANGILEIPSFVKIYENSSAEDSRIDSVKCSTVEPGLICENGKYGLKIYVPEGGVKLNIKVDGEK